MGHTGFRACQGGTGAPESTVESVPRKPGKHARKEHRTPYARDIISAGGALGEVIVIELCVVFCRERSQTCGRSGNNMQHNMAKTDHKHSISGHVSKTRGMQEVIFGSALWEWSSCGPSCCEHCLESTWLGACTNGRRRRQ